MTASWETSCKLRERRQLEIVREIDLDPEAFADRDRGQHVQVAIEHAARGRGETGAGGLSVCVGKARGSEPASRAVLREARQRANRDGGAKDLEIMTVHCVLQPGFADLVEPLELVQAV